MGLIRLMLALSVVLEHSQPIGGYFCIPAATAVNTFFMISGFYMAMICAEKYNLANSAWPFYSNRILRLFPTYWIAVVIALLIPLYLRYVAHVDQTFSWFDEIDRCSILDLVWLTIPNVALVGSDLLFVFEFAGNGSWRFNPGTSENRAGRFLLDSPAWSVGTELWFYLMMPYIARWRTRSLLVVGLISFALQMYMEQRLAWSSYFLFPANLYFFVGGMISYRMFRTRVFSEVLLKVSLPILCLMVAYIAFRQYIPFVRNYSVSMYLPMFFCLPMLFQASKKWSFDRRIGNLSYPIYILHLPLLLLLKLQFSASDGLSAIVGTLIVSMLVLRIVEEPLDRYRQKRVYAALAAPTP